jgi:hypothetical protein
MCYNIYKLTIFRHGEPWREFRTKVQKPVLQPQTVKKYIQPIEEVSDYFIKRYVYSYGKYIYTHNIYMIYIKNIDLLIAVIIIHFIILPV